MIERAMRQAHRTDVDGVDGWSRRLRARSH
jgi:hypothetical protein